LHKSKKLSEWAFFGIKLGGVEGIQVNKIGQYIDYTDI